MLEKLVSEQNKQRIFYIYIENADFYIDRNSVFNLLEYVIYSYDSYS